MPIVATDLVYELVVSGDDGTSNWANILYYWNDDPTPSDPGSQELIDGWITGVRPQWLALINGRVTMTKLSARRLNSFTDFAEETFSLGGGITGDSAPRFTAFSLKKIRTTKETRSGWINIMGVSEIDTNPGGDAISATALARADTLATNLSATLTPTINQFKPVIVGGKYDYQTDPPTLKDESQWVYNLISSVQATNRVTSQVSRKS